MPSPRIKQFEEEHVAKYFAGDKFIKPVYLSVLRSRYYTESWKETEGQPISIRRAKAIANALDNIPAFIRPLERIVGYPEEDAHVMPFTIESIDPKVAEDYIKLGFAKQEEVPEWGELIEYWKPRSLAGIMKNYISERDWQVASARNRYIEVLPGEYTTRTQPDHDTYLNIGLKNIIKTLKSKLKKLEEEWEESIGGHEAIETVDKMNDVKAMIIAAEAVIRWANRYGILAKKMAKEEKNPERKAELLQIADMCAWVPANPPRTFWESIQSHWFVFLAYHFIEILCHGTSLRTDQIFWPWYEQDVVKNKTISRQFALELMEELLIHVDELGRPLPVHRRRALQGVNLLGTYTIGGVKEDGSDACNELTILILDAMDDLRLSHPDFKFRWHPNMNPKVWRRVIEVVRSGLGQPSIKNDPVVIDTLTCHYGFTLEEARSWAVVGCISPAPTINQGRVRRDAWSVRPAKALEMALFNGIDPVLGHETKELANEPLFVSLAKDAQVGPKTGDASKFTSFEQVLEAFRLQMEWMCEKSAAIKTISEHLANMYLKRPFTSCLYHRSLDACRDIIDVPEKGMPWANDPGKVDAVDALVGLKKLVFDDKKYTMKEVLTALQADWEGYEEMRQDFINNAPKFGNDDDYADEIAKWTFAMIADELSKVRDINEASPMPSGLVVSRMFQLAPHTGALTNGRKLGDSIVDGGISPHANFDKKGPMAGVLSASKIDARKQKANIFNQKLTPPSVAGEAGLKKFQNYIETAMDLGLDMIQFNITDAKTLKAAQEHPEEYANLVVRISGYNARFIELNKFVQDSVIERTEHKLV
ncbi:pyruvate formate lyase family protein [Chloroflexota bacterium]